MNAIVALRPQNFSELIQFAERAAKSSMVPKDYQGRPENVLLAVQMGSELGLAPMQSLQNIAVVNGRPAVFGDAMPGLCRQSPLCEDIEERIEGAGEKMVAICIARRVGKKPVEARFSVDDAKRAGLWGKSGTWSQYPQRMLMWRARSWALRDAFPDVLRGLGQVEELRDIEPLPHNGPTIDAAPEPDARDALNDAIPMTKQVPLNRAAAADMPRAPRVSEKPSGERTDEQWKLWLEKLRQACFVLYSRQEVVEIAERDSVGEALAKGPPWVQREISGILAENFKRFPDEPEAEELPDLEIHGADKLAG